MRRLLAWLGAALTATLVVVGCSSEENFGAPPLGDVEADAGGATGTTTPDNGGTCGDGGTGLQSLADPSTLPACSPACGGAHCVPGDKIPAAAQPMFAACGGGFCIPDKLIVSGGAKPPSCVSLGGGAGVCLSTCVPQVGQNADMLPRATCAADERCAPCLDPQTNKPTGACALGQPANGGSCGSDAGGVATPPSGGDSGPAAPACPHVGPPLFDPTTFPACGGANSAAHCLPTQHVPASLQSELASCSGGFCVPDKLIATAGNYIPSTCTSIGGAEGRCQNTVIPSVAAQSNLPQATCDATEKCVPCTNPLNGQDTGACHTSCDPGPKLPPVIFSTCCSNQGKCVTSDVVPASEKQYLNACQNSGSSGLCAPTENLDTSFKPKACHHDGSFPIVDPDYDGVCLSKCLNFGSNASNLNQDNCDSLHLCVPCVDPSSGNPTGAPGC